MSTGDTLRFEGEIEPAALADYLEAMAGAMRDSEMLVESGNRSLSLSLGAPMSFELKVRQGGASTSLAMEMKWKRGETQRAGPALLISSGYEAEEAGSAPAGDPPKPAVRRTGDQDPAGKTARAASAQRQASAGGRHQAGRRDTGRGVRARASAAPVRKAG